MLCSTGGAFCSSPLLVRALSRLDSCLSCERGRVGTKPLYLPPPSQLCGPSFVVFGGWGTERSSNGRAARGFFGRVAGSVPEAEEVDLSDALIGGSGALRGRSSAHFRHAVRRTTPTGTARGSRCECALFLLFQPDRWIPVLLRPAFSRRSTLAPRAGDEKPASCEATRGGQQTGLVRRGSGVPGFEGTRTERASGACGWPLGDHRGTRESVVGIAVAVGSADCPVPRPVGA